MSCAQSAGGSRSTSMPSSRAAAVAASTSCVSASYFAPPRTILPGCFLKRGIMFTCLTVFCVISS